MDVRSRRGRESSPERTRVFKQQPMKARPMTRRVQVVYYLTRNGQLEHPHYMEVTHLANQPLRLRDVMERLTALRGKGMPSLYSWSCKRSYRNGYVWNDLAENDVIYPSDGAEYVLKGSEPIEGCSEKFQELHVSRNRSPHMQELNSHLLHAAPKPRNGATQETVRTAPFEVREFNGGEEDGEEEEEEERDEEYELDEEKTSCTSSTTPQSRCSRGVSTDELELIDQEQEKAINQNSVEPTLCDSEKPKIPSSGNTSKRFEDGDPVAVGSSSGRRSVLLQLIACGNIAVTKAKNVQGLKQPLNGNSKKMNCENLHKGFLRKNVVNKFIGEEEEDKEMIRFMSENPRFGNLQAEEKEYFSGSIIESVSQDRGATELVLKKTNSYNEERSKKASLVEAEEEERREEKAAKGKCIPRRKSSSVSIIKANQEMKS